jgi:hypothetical protein
MNNSILAATNDIGELKQRIKDLENQIAFLKPANEGHIKKIEELEADFKTVEKLRDDATSELYKEQEENQQLRGSLEVIEIKAQELVEILEEDAEMDYIDFVQIIEEIAQKALESK